MWHIMWHDQSMPKVNIRQLRDTRQLKAWLRAGKTVELRERDKLIGKIVPVAAPAEPRQYPDWAAMRREIFGNRVLNAVDTLIKDRRRARF